DRGTDLFALRDAPVPEILPSLPMVAVGLLTSLATFESHFSILNSYRYPVACVSMFENIKAQTIAAADKLAHLRRFL
ncbi:MAG: hypothetical protein ACXWKG_08300, partial [Limisphaerales bacterium]